MKNEKNIKKYIQVGIIILFLFVLILVIYLNENSPENSSVLKFLNYDQKYDGEVELMDYKNITLNIDDMIGLGYEKYLKDLQNYGQEYAEEDPDATIEDDSAINISFKVYNGDEEIRSTENLDLKLSDVFCGYEFTQKLKEQIVGKKAKQEWTILLDGSKDSTMYDYDGVELRYEGVVNFVRKPMIIPELTDEYILEQTGFDSIETVKESFYKAMIDSIYANSYTYDYYIKDYLLYLLRDGSNVLKEATPVVNLYNKSSEYIFKQAASESNMTEEEYCLSNYGMSKDDFYEQYVNTVSGKDTILINIAIAEKIDLSEDAYQKYLKDIANNYNYDSVNDLLEDAGDYYNEDATRQEFVEDTVLGYILDNFVTIDKGTYADYIDEVVSNWQENVDESTSGDLVNILDVVTDTENVENSNITQDYSNSAEKAETIFDMNLEESNDSLVVEKESSETTELDQDNSNEVEDLGLTLD